MSEDNEHDRLEIAHVLFMDIVGYSKLLTSEQRESLQRLNEIVRATDQFRAAESAGKLVRLSTGDGMALAFFTSPDAPARCALQIAEALKNGRRIPLRMGIHSGPVDPISDVNDRPNIAGAGINMAQRVMNCGDAGHILLSKRAADDLAQHAEWRPRLHALGEMEVKHGLRIGVANLCFDGVGNPTLPEKLKNAARAKRRQTISWIALGLLLLVGGIGASLLFSRAASKHVELAKLPEKSIAVLPFENLSPEKDDAFFAEGIQDDVLTSLGKIKDLTVIARASVMGYRGAAVSGKLGELGKALGVAHVLQGSIRRSGDRVVMNVQLIDTRNERQLWSERYDRTISDMLSLQGELAVEIAREMRATLSPAEADIVATKPTENPEAYLLYLRAREIEIAAYRSEEHEAAVKLYQQATALDPKFALARARLSMALSFLAAHFRGKDVTHIPKALAEAEEALRLRPNLGEGRLALAYYYFRGKSDFEGALAELSRAAELLPNSAEVWNTYAQIYKRQDKLRERIAALEHAEILDPRNTQSLGLLANTFQSVRNWPEFAQTGNRLKAVLPPDSAPIWWLAYGEFRRSAVIDPLKKAVAEAPKAIPPENLSLYRYELAMLERDFSAAERVLGETSPEVFDNWTSTKPAPPRSMAEALLAVARGAEPAVMEARLVTARQECEKVLADNPDFRDPYGALGLIDAFRGRKEDAIREGRRWMQLENYSVLEKNDAAANMALIYARTGETDEAIKLIEKLLTVPANLTPNLLFNITQADLKWRWVWDPLRSDPRFQKILAGPEPKTVY